jgi:hypothetical protein
MRHILLLLLLAPVASAQITWYVDVDGAPPGTGTFSDPYTSIQYAIDQPTTGLFDTLSVAAGTYVENVDFNSKSVDIVGSAGPEHCTIRAAVPGPVVRIDQYGGIEGFTITGGHLPGKAHGVYVDGGGPRIERCLLTGNEGHGVRNDTTDHTYVIHCTIAYNGMSGIETPVADLTLENSIVWFNDQEPVLGFGAYAQGGFFYNCIRDEFAPPGCNYYELYCGNIATNPLLWDGPNGDFRLKPGSPCIDAGKPTSPKDPDGSVADVGALAYDPTYAPPPSAYCTSKVNSQGCSPTIGSTGNASASGATFDITCANVLNNKQGLLFYSYTPKQVPYQGGYLCVQAPTKRTPAMSSGGNPPPDDCSGSYTFDFNARIQSGIDPGLVAGALVYAQYWFRDPQQAGFFTTGRSDALSFGVAP